MHINNEDLVDEVVRVRGATQQLIPLVLDSPHSGTFYPSDFGHQVPIEQLRWGEDTHVERLFEDVLDIGGVMIDALFPRTYIDPNRARSDLKVDDLCDGGAGKLPFELKPSAKSKRGIGLIWTRAPVLRSPMYQHPISPAVVMHRLSRYYDVYHDKISQILDATHRRFGYFIHVNCHSMASRVKSSTLEEEESMRPDFVIGDRDGTTCAQGVTRQLERSLKQQGYSVSINDPYKGVELVRAYSDPQVGRHSVQLEVNRRLYMNEKTREPIAKFTEIQRVLGQAVGTLLEWDLSKAARL